MTFTETPRDAGRGRVWEAAGAPRRSIPSFLPSFLPSFRPGHHSVVVGTPDLRKTALYTAEFCRAVAKCLLEAPLPGMVFGMSDVSVDLSGELERLTVTLLKLRRRCGHPGRQAFLKTLKARGSDARTLAVASQLKCPECQESQMKAPVPQVSLEKEEVLWRTVQMDAFYFRHDGQVHHFILFMDEASSFAVVSEILVHDAEEGANIVTEGAIDALEQYFGYPLRLRCDLEGCFRGRGLEDYTASRG